MKTAIASTTVLVLATAASAQFVLTSSTIDGGGGKLQGTTYTLNDTVGQPDAGVLAGASNSITGGFWHAAMASCPGDADGNNMVDLADLNLVLFNFGSTVPAGTSGDVDSDGDVDLGDLNLVLFNFGNSC